MPFNNTIGRGDLGDVLMPDQVINDIIAEAPKSSIILARAARARLSSKKAKQPVLTTLPEAFWVNGDTGLKQTTKSQWENVYITSEEIAALVPIPDAVIDDASVPLWDQIKPLLAEAVGKTVDLAALFGINKPDTWPAAVVPESIRRGNAVAAGTGKDFGVDVAKVGELVSLDGYGVNGFASAPGLQWRLVGLRSDQGVPIYTPSLAEGTPSGLYGYPLNEALNGSWQPYADLFGADWTKFVVGIRQDITYKLLDQAVITDADGKVIFNAPQQDSQILRVVMRVGFQTALPMTRVNPDRGSAYPAGTVLSAGAARVKSTNYLVGNFVTEGGHVYEVTTAGKTGTTAPTAPGVGNTVTDGTAVLTQRV